MAGLSGIVNIGYHGTSPTKAASIAASGFRGGNIPTWAGTGKTFTSPNINVASRYGPSRLGVVSSARNLTSPIGGGFNKYGISFGKEIVSNPAQATKGMNLYNKLMSGIYSSSPTAQRLLQTGTTAIKNPFNWAKAANIPLSALIGVLTPTTANADEVEWEKQLMRNISMRDKIATKKGIAQAAMQKRIQEAERQRAAAAAAQAAAAQQVRQNIQTYGSGDRPNVGINRPGGGRGQSPTGGDVAGTPFYRGGLASLYG